MSTPCTTALLDKNFNDFGKELAEKLAKNVKIKS